MNKKIFRSKEEVDKLKQDWLADPCWDIWDTEGFEDYQKELEEFQETQERTWDKLYKKQQTRIFQMKLHDRIFVKMGIEVLRVSGGWIYIIDKTSQTFVPYGEEFKA